MAGDWKDCWLGDVVELKRGYDLPQKERLPGDVPLVSSSGVTDTHAKAMVTGPGVVTGRYGTLGQVFYVEQDFWPLNTTLYVRDFKGNDPRFISYFLRDVDFLAYSDKAAVPGLNRNHLHQARVRIPTEPREQRAIAHILGTLDDKIELNRKQNETLEAMARTLFKAWFVDFEPVRAKLEGRWQRGQSLPGLPAHLYDLFPDRLIDSELGEIPEGWGVARIEIEFDLIMGQSPPGETYNESGDGVPFYQGRTDFGARFPRRRVYCTAPTRLAKKNDTLISVRAPVGDINMCAEDCAIGRGVAAARHKSGSRSYTYQFMLGLEKVFAGFEAEGTVFGSIGKKAFDEIPCVSSPPRVIGAFEALLSPIDGLIEILARETDNLSFLRDTLLPKLISGELRVKDAGAFLRERGL